MTGKTYPKDFEKYWKLAKAKSTFNPPIDGRSRDIKKIAFNAYRAGVRHTNGEHSRARAKYWARKHRRGIWA